MKKQSGRKQVGYLLKTPLYIPVFFLLFTSFLLSCNSNVDNHINSSAVSTDSTRSSIVQIASLDSVVRWLLDSSAKDFNDHQPPIPVAFRNVQIKYSTVHHSEMQYMICGDFLTRDKQNKNEWIPFATIKTSGYEQLIGAQSLTYRKESKVISYKISDLSSELKNRVDSLYNRQHLRK